MNKPKKAQVWYVDFMVGLLILITSLLIYYQYQDNLSGEYDAEWQEMILDSKTITSSLITAGYPLNWTNETVSVLGVTDGNYRINSTKIEQFSNLSYKRAKDLLRTRFNFYFFLEDGNGARPYEKGLNATDHSFLVQATRFVIYNSSIHRMVVQLWMA
jgi:hypothetical protein